MRLIIISITVLLCLSATAQEKVLNQCFVLILDTPTISDLREASFDLPFAAMRASADNKKKIVPHYAFDIQSQDANTSDDVSSIAVLSMRPYEYGETLADNEISFFVMQWPDDRRPTGMGSFLASFPSINDHKVTTTHLRFDSSIELSSKLVSQLGLISDTIKKGTYRISRIEMEY